MAAEVLDTRALNRALLARQSLLQRSTRALTTVVEQIGGIQTQYAPSAYIGLWARVEGFRRRHLTDALESRRLVQGSLMRITIHIVSRRDYPHLLAAIRSSRREWWLRIARQRGLQDTDYEAVASLLRRELAEGPRQHAELIDALLGAGYPKQIWEGAGLWVDMVRVPPSGTWERRRADRYHLAETWVGPLSMDEEEGVRLLCRRYLSGFGPASVRDIASWSGIPLTKLRPVVDSLRLRRYVTESGEELVDLPRGQLPDPSQPAPVRFLPTWDATLLAHARRTGILPEEYRPRVFHTKNPQSVPTFLVDGRVAGAWRHDAGRIQLEPFAPLPRTVRRELEEEAIGLAALHNDP